MSLIKVNTIQNANGTTALVIAANGQLSSVNTAVANVTTLNATSGVLATQNGMTGIAKAWVNFNGTGTVAIRASFNVSSITDNGTGNYTVNFTTAMPNANYSVAGSTVGSGNGGRFIDARGVALATSSCQIGAWSAITGTLEDTDCLSIQIFSS